MCSPKWKQSLNHWTAREVSGSLFSQSDSTFSRLVSITLGALVPSGVQLFSTPWTAAHQAPLSMGFSRQEYWSGLSFHSPGDLPDPGIESRSPSLQADFFFFFLNI